MKRVPVKPIQLSPEQVQTIQTLVFEAVEKQLDPRFYLLDVAFEKEAGAWYLRIYVEGRGFPISLNDCSGISQSLDAVIEALPILASLSYSLEISSPGVFRPLKTQREFDFYRENPVRIETYAPKGTKKNAKPELLGFEEGILQAFDGARGVVMLKKTQSPTPVEITLTEHNVVYLNPVIHFPDDAEPLEETELVSQ